MAGLAHVGADVYGSIRGLGTPPPNQATLQAYRTPVPLPSLQTIDVYDTGGTGLMGAYGGSMGGRNTFGTSGGINMPGQACASRAWDDVR